MSAILKHQTTNNKRTANFTFINKLIRRNESQRWRAGCDGADLTEWAEGFEEAYQKVLDNQSSL